jgi:hypothetical protein
MDDLPFNEGELDLIWCEGVIDNIGAYYGYVFYIGRKE